jgi:hypothetical protein
MDLQQNLKQHGLVLKQMPLVIQFNKRDLDGVRSDQDIVKLADKGREPVYLAVATEGRGVVESFMGLLFLTWSALDAEHDLTRKFGFDSEAFLGDVAVKLGQVRSLTQLLAARVGGALEVLRPEADAS